MAFMIRDSKLLRSSRSFLGLLLSVGIGASTSACDSSAAVFRPPEDGIDDSDDDTGGIALDDDEDEGSNDARDEDEGVSAGMGTSTSGGADSSFSGDAGTSTSGFGTTTSPGTTSIGGTTGTEPPMFDPQTIEAESATISGPYASMVTSPFSGVGLFGNDDTVTTNVTFPQVPGTYVITITGASSSTTAAVGQVRVGTGTTTTVSFTGTTPQERTVMVTLQAGQPATQAISIVITNDDGTWDLFVDKFEIAWAG